MTIYFATQNKHKFEEISLLFKKEGIEVKHFDIPYSEDKDLDMQDIAKNAAQLLANEHNKVIMTDDSGIFFDGYNNFPGVNSKVMFQALGYEGLLKLVAGTSRNAYFLSCIALCKPNSEPIVFSGRMDGRISMMPFNLEKDVMPYERIFVPVGSKLTLSGMTREQKNEISHRRKALQQLIEYLKKNPL